MKKRQAYRGEDGIWRLPLDKGQETTLDEIDALWAQQWPWRVDIDRKRNTKYASRRDSGVTVRLHREIAARMGLSTAEDVDHVDCNGLRNERANLRAASRSDNKCNVGRRADNKTGAKGVSYCQRDRLYRAAAERLGVKLSSHHKQFEDAVAAVKRYREQLHGEFTRHE